MSEARPRGLGPQFGSQAVLLGLLAFTLLSVRIQLSGAEAWYSLLLFVQIAGPLNAVACALAGAGVALEGGSDRALNRSAAFVLAQLVGAWVCAALLLPPLIEEPGDPWRILLFWQGGIALPTWAGAAWVGSRGPTSTGFFVGYRALFAGLAYAAVALMLGLGVGVASWLDDRAMLLSTGSAGALAALTLAVATWERVSARWWVVMVAGLTLATGVSFAASRALVALPLRLHAVGDFVDVDPTRTRALLVLAAPNSQVRRLVDLDLRDGTWEALPPTVARAAYWSGGRVEVRVPGWSLALDRPAAASVCVGDWCPVVLDSASLPLPWGTGESPWAGAFGRSSVAVLDAERRAFWKVDRSGELILWPCLTQGGGLSWRVRTESGPYRRERLDLQTGEISVVDLEFQDDCLGQAARGGITLHSGEHRVGRKARVTAPGWPGPFVFPRTPRSSSLSRDGRVLAVLAHRSEGPLALHLFGLDSPTPRVRDVPSTWPSYELSPDGDWGYAWAGEPRDGRDTLVLHDAYGIERARLLVPPQIPGWDWRGRLLLVDDGFLQAVDPQGGGWTRVFPPEVP